MATPASSPTLPQPAIPALGVAPRLAYLLMFLGSLPVAVTGIGSFLTGQAPMSHWILMAHVGASPAFALGLAWVALTWPSREARYGAVNTFFFWLMLLAGWIIIVSGVVPMTPILGTPGQHFLYLTHRYAGMAFVALFVLHFITLRPKR